MRGASALQDVLSEAAGSPLRVFVVWEPVIATDVGPPTTSTLSLIHDVRARQYWDQDRALSEDIVRAVLADPGRYSLSRDDVDEETIVWDVVALFPEGTLWEGDLPPPAFYGAPVVESIDGLREALSASGGAAR